MKIFSFKTMNGDDSDDDEGKEKRDKEERMIASLRKREEEVSTAVFFFTEQNVFKLHLLRLHFHPFSSFYFLPIFLCE